MFYVTCFQEVTINLCTISYVSPPTFFWCSSKYLKGMRYSKGAGAALGGRSLLLGIKLDDGVETKELGRLSLDATERELRLRQRGRRA